MRSFGAFFLSFHGCLIFLVQVYYAVVNGLTGEVEGDRPYTMIASLAMGKTGIGSLIGSFFGGKK